MPMKRSRFESLKEDCMLDEILFMQMRLFRMYREQTGLSAQACNMLFEQQGIWNFIANCYDYLHLEGDEAILADIKVKLASQGAAA